MLYERFHSLQVAHYCLEVAGMPAPALLVSDGCDIWHMTTDRGIAHLHSHLLSLSQVASAHASPALSSSTPEATWSVIPCVRSFVVRSYVRSFVHSFIHSVSLCYVPPMRPTNDQCMSCRLHHLPEEELVKVLLQREWLPQEVNSA